MRYFILAALVYVALVVTVRWMNRAAPQTPNDQVYVDVLEAIVVKQRNELFKRGYATDDSVCIGRNFVGGWCTEHYLKGKK